MKKFILLFIFQLTIVFPGISQSAAIYDNNMNIALAHQSIYALKIQSAESLLQTEERANPKNGYIVFNRFYAEVIDLVISNSPDKYKKVSPKLDEYIDRIEKLPRDAPDYKMLLGEAKVYSGMLNVKYGSKLSGMLECLKGYKLLESNGKQYPEFEPNKKIPGIIHIAVSFMPKVLRWCIKILGIKGDPVTGLKELSDYSKFARGKPGMNEEAFLLTMGAFKIMGQDELAMKLIKARMNGFKDIALLNYLAATMCLESNEAETAITMLSNISAEKLETPFPPVFYLTGRAKLFRLDPDAHVPMKRFLKESNGPDFQKATLYNLACLALASGEKDEYLNYMNQVKLKGRELSNRDIEAEYESEATGLPNIHLMRAGLLIRGGYAQKAWPELLNVQNMTNLTIEEQVRFHFLSGEYNRLINNSVEAENNYLKAINIGYEKGLDNSQHAIIQLGLMKEKSGLNQEAEKYFKQCLDFKDNDSPYSDLYNNKAKAGLIRLSQQSESHSAFPAEVLLKQ
jgi:hypothetical protein